MVPFFVRRASLIRKVNRVFLLVMDSAGIGEMPDADQYGDRGSNTLRNLARAVGGLSLPNLERLGLGGLTDILGVAPREPAGASAVVGVASPGKDTMTGHWEMVGIRLKQPLRTYPEGFPPNLIAGYEEAIGRRVIGNKVASGTEIIKELGEEHMKTGRPIVYTSADSVFQVAAHEEVIPIEELYRICQIAREYLSGEHLVGRVIARPFLGSPGSFYRTSRRHDYALEPPERMLLDALAESGIPVTAVGKIRDIFSGRGIAASYPTKGNPEGLETVIRLADETKDGLVFANLVDFDMLYGHRNDARGYAEALEYLDARIPEIEARLGSDDILMITADHGCDPTTVSTDHSREYVPWLTVGRAVRPGTRLGLRPTLADIGATVGSLFGVGFPCAGNNLAEAILKKDSG